MEKKHKNKSNGADKADLKGQEAQKLQAKLRRICICHGSCLMWQITFNADNS